jgi:hypothetical protein
MSFMQSGFFFNPLEAREDFETCNLGYGYLQYNIFEIKGRTKLSHRNHSV